MILAIIKYKDINTMEENKVEKDILEYVLIFLLFSYSHYHFINTS